jgi:hypothetical protein
VVDAPVSDSEKLELVLAISIRPPIERWSMTK